MNTSAIAQSPGAESPAFARKKRFWLNSICVSLVFFFIPPLIGVLMRMSAQRRFFEAMSNGGPDISSGSLFQGELYLALVVVLPTLAVLSLAISTVRYLTVPKMA